MQKFKKKGGRKLSIEGKWIEGNFYDGISDHIKKERKKLIGLDRQWKSVFNIFSLAFLNVIFPIVIWHDP